nr:hypothetical protein CFP56_07161 [Quercus suber]
MAQATHDEDAPSPPPHDHSPYDDFLMIELDGWYNDEEDEDSNNTEFHLITRTKRIEISKRERKMMKYNGKGSMICFCFESRVLCLGHGATVTRCWIGSRFSWAWRTPPSNSTSKSLNRTGMSAILKITSTPRATRHYCKP